MTYFLRQAQGSPMVLVDHGHDSLDWSDIYNGDPIKLYDRVADAHAAVIEWGGQVVEWDNE